MENEIFIFEERGLYGQKKSKYLKSCNNSAKGEITIPDGVDSIGKDAFSGCVEVTSIFIPDSVTIIWERAFQGCIGLKNIRISENLEHIAESAFEGCSGLTEINIHSKVIKHIKERAFAECTGLTSFIFPENVWSIANSMFFGCISLKEIHIPKDIVRIGYDAFNGCSELTKINIPRSVSEIGDSAFESCTGLTTIVIPPKVTEIEGHIFKDCTGLTEITIPDKVRFIQNGAFEGCTGLKKITIPDSVEAIADSAFEGCSSLESIKIPESANKWIHKFTFSDCKNLTSIKIPNNVIYIDSFAFCDCINLKSITIPDSVESIGSSAFKGCIGLTAITIPDSVKAIGESAFEGCTGLTAITIPNYVETIGKNAFKDCTITCIDDGMRYVGSYLVEVIDKEKSTYKIKDGTKHICNSIFSDCEKMETVIIPESVTSIPEDAFANCEGLTEITIPNNITRINRGTFVNCSNLKSVTIPDSVTEIGKYAFERCKELKSINIPSSVTSIEDDAFSYSGLEEIKLSHKLQELQPSAFRHTKLPVIDNLLYADTYLVGISDPTLNQTNYTVKKGTKYICEEVFANCKEIESIELPDSVITIGDAAFYECENLTTICVPNSIKEIGKRAFIGVRSIKFSQDCNKFDLSLLSDGNYSILDFNGCPQDFLNPKYTKKSYGNNDYVRLNDKLMINATRNSIDDDMLRSLIAFCNNKDREKTVQLLLATPQLCKEKSHIPGYIRVTLAYNEDRTWNGIYNEDKIIDINTKNIIATVPVHIDRYEPMKGCEIHVGIIGSNRENYAVYRVYESKELVDDKIKVALESLSKEIGGAAGLINELEKLITTKEEPILVTGKPKTKK